MDKEINISPPKVQPIFESRDDVGNFEMMRGEDKRDIEYKTVFELSRKASQQIAATSIRERIAYIRKLKTVIVSQQEFIINTLVEQIGKSRLDALVSEVFAVVDYLDYLIKSAYATFKPEKIKNPWSLFGKKSLIWYEPLGSVLIIAPWNYPFFQGIVPTLTAFVAGNAVIYKPSEHSPLTGLLERIFQEAQFPAHYIQIVYGNSQVGKQLINLRPEKIFFTGRTETGKKILRQAAEFLIPVELELGGKDPMVVFADADMERAAAAALWGGFTNAGQACTSIERVYIEAQAYDRFKTFLLKKAQKITFSTTADRDIDVGRMATQFGVNKVAELLDDAVKKGADILTGHTWDRNSALIPPIIVENVPSHARLSQEEIFGPILPLYKFSGEDEAVFHCNNTLYGLSASVWTANIAKAKRVATRIVTGNISINNVMMTENNHALPFGGAKSSGMGRFKGRIGLRSFCNVKSVIIDKSSSKIESHWYPYTTNKYKLFSKMLIAKEKRSLMGVIRLVIATIRLESHAKKMSK